MSSASRRPAPSPRSRTASTSAALTSQVIDRGWPAPHPSLQGERRRAGMNRREVLTSGAVAAVGAGFLAACREAGGRGDTVPPAGTGGQPRRRAGSFIEAADGTSLFHLDWGSGKPVLFVHAWALSADLWEYQMTELAERGL